MKAEEFIPNEKETIDAWNTLDNYIFEKRLEERKLDEWCS